MRVVNSCEVLRSVMKETCFRLGSLCLLTMCYEKSTEIIHLH
jgi:hypothetical protein